MSARSILAAVVIARALIAVILAGGFVWAVLFGTSWSAFVLFFAGCGAAAMLPREIETTRRPVKETP